MHTPKRVLPALIFCAVLVLVSGQQDPEPMTNCIVSSPAGEGECSTVITGVCSLTLEGESFDIPVDRPPTDNSRSRFRTCNSDGSGTVCEADRVRFENNGLVNVNGPANTSVMYNYFKVFSRQFQNERPYPPNEFALYNVFCGTPTSTGTVLSVTLDTHNLPPATSNPSCPDQCVDYIDFNFPLGQNCRTCGSELTKTCEEILGRPSGVKTLDSIHHFSGTSPFTIQFRSNRDQQTEFDGFQFLTSCVEESFYCFRNCTTPDRGRARKRSTGYGMDGLEKLLPSLVRGRRSYRVVWIVVTEETAVSYSDFTVRVFRDNIWLYKFPNTRIFQVFNFVEGYGTFYRNAFVFSRNATAPPVIRIFPGYGFLKIGRGIIQYIQTGVNPRFLPSPAETEIILRLRRRIIEAPEFLDEDPLAPDDPGTPPAAIRTPRTFTAAEIAKLDADALMFGSACNGILRADACVYQQLFLGGVNADCLIM